MSMHTLYNLVTGPLAWAAFLIFLVGLLAKFIYLFYLAKKKDPTVFAYLSAKYAIRSMFMWSIPFVAKNWRLRPVFTIVTFAFHICLLGVPLFLMAHVIHWSEGTLGVSYWSLPDQVADWMTVVVVVACVFFAVRRIVVPEAKYVTNAKDFLMLVLVAAPFITGFLAYHQIFDYKVMIILHILSGEVWLAIIPFTWLSHMLLAPMVRGYMGSEFGAVRHVKDW